MSRTSTAPDLAAQARGARRRLAGELQEVLVPGRPPGLCGAGFLRAAPAPSRARFSSGGRCSQELVEGEACPAGRRPRGGSRPTPASSSRAAMARRMSSPVCRISGSRKPRVVTAGEPTRRPLATLMALSSKGTTLRLAVMFTLLEQVLALEAVDAACSRRSTSARWTSVPPETRRRPPSASVSARAAAVGHDLPLQSAELLALGDAQHDRLGGDHMRQRPALHAREHGPVDRLARSSARHMMRPARGPVSVLCVVLVTTSATTAPGWGARRRPPAPRCGPCRP